MATYAPVTPHVEARPSRSPARQSYEILHWGLAAAPIIAGLDKFANILTRWDQYLAPQFVAMSGLAPRNFMMVVGMIEVVAGLIVAIKPRVGAWILAAWLVGIIVNLMLVGDYFDVALRDFGLMLAAIALGRLATSHEKHEIP